MNDIEAHEKKADSAYITSRKADEIYEKLKKEEADQKKMKAQIGVNFGEPSKEERVEGIE